MTALNKKISIITEEIKKISKKDISLMEVCGTHTMSIARFGIKSLLPSNINIISGPGCPVCVTSAGDIKAVIDLAKRDDSLIVTFGDLLKVPSQNDSLQNYANVIVVYSPLDALKIAHENPSKNIIFLGIGFETTAPLIASVIEIAQKSSLSNFSVFSMHKLVPPALEIIMKDIESKINGFILPGHVSVITGRKYFEFIKEFNVAGVITGFEALDIVEAIYLLTKNINLDKVVVLNNYTRAVSEDGNKFAQKTMFDVFDIADACWRGIGTIPKSGLTLKREYERFDAARKFQIKEEDIEDAPGCLCGSILMGKVRPCDCSYFGKRCTPSNPVGPCMVSNEGTCAAFYKYRAL